MRDKIIKYLRHVGDDFAPEDKSQDTSPECKGQGEDGLCPDHQDCGICRFEYMKREGWLSSELT
ncbi:hypothetical protein ES703_09972 [subsurface metagenome]